MGSVDWRSVSPAQDRWVADWPAFAAGGQMVDSPTPVVDSSKPGRLAGRGSTHRRAGDSPNIGRLARQSVGSPGARSTRRDVAVDSLIADDSPGAVLQIDSPMFGRHPGRLCGLASSGCRLARVVTSELLVDSPVLGRLAGVYAGSAIVGLLIVLRCQRGLMVDSLTGETTRPVLVDSLAVGPTRLVPGRLTEYGSTHRA
jgi:hypothetical protein